MAGSVNVNTSVSDQFYRYKMPRLIAKVEGKGNGIKTVIVNMAEVAKALSRPPTYPTKFFGCELGAQTQFDFKNERYIVNGSHDASKLQSLLDGFIKKFVLCPDCSNPETNLNVSVKKQIILQRCIACGYSGIVDMNHKLTTYILRNPPDQEPGSTPSKKEKKKRDKHDKHKKDEEKKSDNQDNGHTDNAQQQMAAQRASGGVVDAPPEVAGNKEDEDDWGEDVSEDAVKMRMEQLTDAAKGLAFSDDLEKTPQERLNMIYKYVEQKRDADTLAGADKEILAEAERLEVKDKCPLILVELLLSDKVLQDIKTHRILFLRFCHGNKKAQKYMLGGLEQLIGNVYKENLMPKVPHILKTLYDLDILDEEVLIEWGTKVSKKYVSKAVAQEIHDKAQPFISWLKEAEEEDDDDEEDDENVEVVYSTTEKVGAHTVEPEKDEPEEEDDFDIDAI
ncbi:eukaryotic translation initiation factor 5-like [Liolophura sinensis]|uniref:eukaryotic translation initiation factor 5-like n=1 Tax=Liolophura sinensis TaxID=3198878 RepID=UPI00315876DC